MGSPLGSLTQRTRVKCVASSLDTLNTGDDPRTVNNECNEIDSLAISPVSEDTGVTSFVQEACSVVTTLSPSFTHSIFPPEPSLQDIAAYFKRPVCMTAGPVPLGTRTRFYNYLYTIPTAISYWQTGAARLLGAYGMRCTAVFTFQIAATPFHQGLVCLSFQYGVNGAVANTYIRSTEPCTSTNLPHVVLDFAVDTMVQLRVPYISTGEYSTIAGSLFESPIGYLALCNLLPAFVVGGLSAPTYQLFISLEDIELFGAVPQSTTAINLQAGRKLSPVVEEFEKDSHPFSSALSALGRSISFIAKGVPALSSIGGTTSWALGKAAGLVRYFGYGKPAIVEPIQRVFRTDAISEWNTDVATPVLVIAATAANTTAISPNVGYCDVDEMSLSFITSRWSQINTFLLTTSSTTGSSLYVTPISPLAWWFRATVSSPSMSKFPTGVSTATTNSIQPTHLMFAASMFKQWRGGVKFRFTFAKTKMHAGRVMVTFAPAFSTPSLTQLLANSGSVQAATYGNLGVDPFGYSAIFDLKDSNVFEFEVPFICPVPYANLAASTGCLAMYVVNPLLASAVISTSVGVMVEICGMPDFELANPAGCLFAAHNAGTISVQAGRILSETADSISQNTMGESINSVKQLIAIPHTVNISNAVAFNSVVVPPWYFQPTPSGAVPAGNAALRYSFSYAGNWASCYVFQKGGTDIHAYSIFKDQFFSIRQVSAPGGFLPNTITLDNQSHSNAPICFSGESAIHARLPGFHPVARMFTWVANALVSSGATWPFNPWSSGTSISPFFTIQSPFVLSNFSLPPSVTTNYFFSRNASDDAQLAQYIGPPPLWLGAVNAGAGPYDPDLNAPF